MKTWQRVIVFGAVILLAACGGSSTPPQASTSSPQLLAQVATANGVTTFSGNRANYTITKTGSGYMVTDNVGTEGTSNLIAPTRLMFADAGIAYDLSGVAGKAYRVYQAAFNRAPDTGGLGFWVYNMDQGASLTSVASGFMASEEFKARYGANPGNASFVTSLYTNVLHRALDQGGYDYWVGNLNNNAISMPDVLAFFSESDENKAQVASAIANGISYTPYAPPVVLAPLTLTQLSACPDSVFASVPQFYKCMVGTISGQTRFDNAPCTLTIGSTGEIALTVNGTSTVIKPPYDTAYYNKFILLTADTFSILASPSAKVNNVNTMFGIRVTSPKYAALTSGALFSGIQVTVASTVCQFAL